MMLKKYDSEIELINSQSNYALKNIIKALSGLEMLNTDQQNARLKLAKLELKKRGQNHD